MSVVRPASLQAGSRASACRRRPTPGRPLAGTRTSSRDVEGDHRHAVRRIARRRGDPVAHGAGLVDAFLKDLPVLAFLVEHELIGVLRRVELANWFQMPSCRNRPSMPKVRDSSGTIGTMCLPIALSRNRVCRICTNAMVVDISRSSVLFRKRSNVDSGGTGRDSALRRREGRYPPSSMRLAFMYSASGEPGAKFTKGTSSSLSSGTGIWNRSRRCGSSRSTSSSAGA